MYLVAEGLDVVNKKFSCFISLFFVSWSRPIQGWCASKFFKHSLKLDFAPFLDIFSKKFFAKKRDEVE